MIVSCVHGQNDTYSAFAMYSADTMISAFTSLPTYFVVAFFSVAVQVKNSKTACGDNYNLYNKVYTAIPV